MPKLDSQDYLNILEQLPAEQQEKLHQPGLKLNGSKQRKIQRQIRLKQPILITAGRNQDKSAGQQSDRAVSEY